MASALVTLGSSLQRAQQDLVDQAELAAVLLAPAAAASPVVAAVAPAVVPDVAASLAP